MGKFSHMVNARNSLHPKSVETVHEILRRRNTFGSPGAALTWGVGGASRGELEAGLLGEKITAEIINTKVAESQKRKIKSFAFHSLAWPEGEGDTDHVYLQGETVIIIDSKRWKGKRKYSLTPSGQVMRGKTRFQAGKVSMPYALKSWRRILPAQCEVFGIVCIAQDQVWVEYDNNWKKAPFRLVSKMELGKFIQQISDRSRTDITLNTEKVAHYMLTHLIKGKPERRSIFEGAF